MSNSTFIYALTDPRPSDLHIYIGKADRPRRRFAQHIFSADQEQNYKARWIRLLARIGLKPGLEILQEVPKSEWETAEATLIHWYRVLGWRVVNSTDGGEGLNNPTAETRLKLSLVNRGRKASDETRMKLSKAHVGLPISPEARLNLSKALTGRTLQANHRAAIGASMTGERNPWFGKRLSAEHRAKIGRKGERHPNFGKPNVIRSKLNSLNSGPRHPRFGKPVSQETRAKIGAANRGRRHSPEARAKISAVQVGKSMPPEVRAKISKALVGRPISLETRAKISLARRRRLRKAENQLELFAA